VFLDRPSAFLPEDIGSVLKEGAKVCQRQLVNEMLGPLTPTQRRGRSAHDGSVRGTHEKYTTANVETRWLLKRNHFKLASTA
jgi:hypothetical protein